MRLYDENYIIKALKNDYSYNSEIKLSFMDNVLAKGIGTILSIFHIGIYMLSKVPLVSSVIEIVSRVYSRDAVGFFLRGAYYSAKLKKMGKNVIIDTGAILWNPSAIEIGNNTHIDTYSKIEAGIVHGGSVTIGDYTHIGHNTHLHGGGILVIGNNVGIASNVKIYSASNFHHDPNNPDRFVNMSIMSPLNEQYVLKKPVVIEDYAFIAMGSVILPGVKVGKGAIIGAGSIVNSDIPPYAIALGIPARIVKRRISKEEYEKNK